MGSLITVNGKQIYCEVFGPEDGPPMLYLHGGPGSSCLDFVEFQKRFLEQHIRVIAIDQRGVLRSEAIGEDEAFGMKDLIEDCEGLRKALGIERWCVLGHSFGGQLAIEYALAYPAAVTGLLLESPGLDWDSTLRSHLTSMAVEFLAEDKPELAVKCWDLADEQMETDAKMRLFLELQAELGARWERTHIHSVDKKDTFARLVKGSGLPIERFQQVWTHVIKLLDEGMVYRSMLPHLSKIEVPTVLLLGKYDRVTTTEQVRAFVTHVRHCRVIVFEQSAHFPRIDERERYAEHVIRFVHQITSDEAAMLA